jgi:hypothetical protein
MPSPTKPFTPSSWLLMQQIDAAMRKFDASRAALLADDDDNGPDYDDRPRRARGEDFHTDG